MSADDDATITMPDGTKAVPLEHHQDAHMKIKALANALEMLRGEVERSPEKIHISTGVLIGVNHALGLLKKKEPTPTKPPSCRLCAWINEIGRRMEQINRPFTPPRWYTVPAEHDDGCPFKKPAGTLRTAVQCSRCGKAVSQDTGIDLTIRAWVECPECVQAQPDYEAEVAKLKDYINQPENRYKSLLILEEDLKKAEANLKSAREGYAQENRHCMDYRDRLKAVEEARDTWRLLAEDHEKSEKALQAELADARANGIENARGWVKCGAKLALKREEVAKLLIEAEAQRERAEEYVVAEVEIKRRMAEQYRAAEAELAKAHEWAGRTLPAADKQFFATLARAEAAEAKVAELEEKYGKYAEAEEAANKLLAKITEKDFAEILKTIQDQKQVAESADLFEHDLVYIGRLSARIHDQLRRAAVTETRDVHPALDQAFGTYAVERAHGQFRTRLNEDQAAAKRITTSCDHHFVSDNDGRLDYCSKCNRPRLKPGEPCPWCGEMIGTLGTITHKCPGITVGIKPNEAPK